MVRSAKMVMCAYCGCQSEKMEREHVVPKLLFPKPLPQIMVTVPACGKCNDEKKEDDEYLRDFLVIDHENSGVSVIEGPLKEKLIRAAGRGQSLLARDVRDKTQLLPVHSPGGLYLGRALGVPVDHVRANRLFSRIVRGLHFKLYNRRLPDDVKFEVRRLYPQSKQHVVNTLVQMGVQECRSIGDSFQCMHGIDAKDPTVTYWLMRFFNIFITVSTNFGDSVDDEPTDLPRQLTSWLN